MKRLFCDTETTGLTIRHGVWQIACLIEIDDEIVDSIEIECAPFPGDEVEEEAVAMSGMTLEEMRELPQPANECAKLHKFLDKHVDRFNPLDKLTFYGYNASFDFQMLRSWFEKCGSSYFGSYCWTPPVDIATLAARFFEHRRKDISSFRLANVARHLGINVQDASLHGAAYDIRLARDVLRSLDARTAQRQ